MERLLIQIPEKKSSLIKSLLRELGAVIEPDTSNLGAELDAMVKAGRKPTMEEIIEEIKSVRAKL